MLGGEDNLKKVQMWGKRPEEEQERLSSGDEDEDNITSEDSVDEEESEFEEGPSKVPQKQIPKSQDPPASSSRPTVGDKRPPGNKRKCMNPIIIIHEIYFGSRWNWSDARNRGEKRKKHGSKKKTWLYIFNF